MKITTATTNHRVMNPLQIAGNAADNADRVVLLSADAVTVLPRPAEVSHLWAEYEYQKLGDEQAAQWSAHAKQEARPFQVKGAGLQLSAEAVAHAVSRNKEALDQAAAQALYSQKKLAAFRRRAANSKPWYQLGKGILFFGDMAGLAAAAIWLGETVFMATTLAFSAAAAAVISGLIGTEVSDAHRRTLRARSPEKLPAGDDEFAHLFRPAPAGSPVVKRVIMVSLFTALMVGVGIGALRATVDEPVVGLIFAGIALAVAGGSFLVSFAGADEIADLIDNYQADYRKQEKRYLKLAANPAWQESAEQRELAAIINAEYASRGSAAVDHVEALKWRILRNNPSHAGHGPRNTDLVGRATRGEEQAS